MLHFIYCCPECRYVKRLYAECHYAGCRYAECHYAGCRYAECLGAVVNTAPDSFVLFCFVPSFEVVFA